MKGRFLGLLIFLISAGASFYNWKLLVDHGYFYIKLSAVAPFGVLGGLLMIFDPSLARPPGSLDTKRKVIVWVTVALALVLGFINFYLMSNYQP
jgi:hypothetical protein